jgi:hypothetical protein
MSTQLHKTFLLPDGSPVSFHAIESIGGKGAKRDGYYRFNPTSLSTGEISSLQNDLRTYEQRLLDYSPGYLHVAVDGEEVAIFSPQGTACEPFKVPTTASCIEIVGEDYGGELLLAVFPLTHLDPCRRLEAHNMSVGCGKGLLISLVISSLDEESVESTYWSVMLECAPGSAAAGGLLAFRESPIIFVDGLDQLEVPQPVRTLPQPNTNALIRIVVVGLGSSGSNTIDKMIEAGVQDVTFAALNTG